MPTAPVASHAASPGEHVDALGRQVRAAQKLAGTHQVPIQFYNAHSGHDSFTEVRHQPGFGAAAIDASRNCCGGSGAVKSITVALFSMFGAENRLRPPMYCHYVLEGGHIL